MNNGSMDGHFDSLSEVGKDLSIEDQLRLMRTIFDRQDELERRLAADTANYKTQLQLDSYNKIYKATLDLEKKKQKALAKLAEQEDSWKYKKTKEYYDKQLKAAKEYYKKLAELEDKAQAARDKVAMRTEMYDAQKTARNAAKKAAKERQNTLSSDLFGKGNSLVDRAAALKEVFTGGNAFSDSLAILAGLGKQLEQKVDEIAGYKSAIDTRLQGSKSATKGGSYWDQISSDINSSIGASGLVSQSSMASNLKSMVGQGIAFNVEQRAFLQTIKDKIADTFEATNGTLLRLVRIQQEDTTASRLGMESALNSFLNNMYETTEYMGSIANGIKSNLEDSMALMTAKDAVGYEYQVQKWLGSMYSTGVSQSTISKISSALGNISSGKIEGLTGGESGNLVAMAASAAGISLADIMTKGLDESNTNKLLEAMVQYLSGIYSETQGNRVVQQQLASVYGMSAADLKAISSMSSDLSAISGNTLDYSGGLSQLRNMVGTMGKRTSLGGKLSTTWSNFKYGTAAGIANSPALYTMYKTAGLLNDVANGLTFSLPLYMGTGTAQTFSVADLMMSGALGSSLLGGMGSMISSLGDLATGSGNRMANNFGIYNTSTVTRGSGQRGITLSGGSTSESGFVGNSASGDIYNKTMSDTTASANQQVAEASENEKNDVTNKVINDNVSAILTLLQKVIKDDTLHVTTRTEGLIGSWF